MRRARTTCHGLLAAFTLIAGVSWAEPITVGETLKLQSKILGEERKILISTPLGYSQSEERYPVLYLTDGDAHLVHTRGTVDFLARNGLMPDVIVVGVANTDRTRDLSPTRQTQARPDGTREQLEYGGGAAKFLDFFAQELIPFVESHYRTAPHRILAGHSLGGLFSLTALTERPDIFNAFIAASPALSWDDDFIIRQTEKFFAGRSEFKRTLFVTMADEEKGAPPPTRLERLRAALRASKASGFSWETKLMADEDHGTVVLRSHYWGLRKIFDGWRLPVDSKTRRFTGSLSDLQKHYVTLHERYGVAAQPPEAVLNQVGYQHLLANEIGGALPFFRHAVELYPNSANVFDSLGEALEKGGKNKEALACYEKAVDLGKKAEDRRLPVFTRNRDRLAAAVSK